MADREDFATEVGELIKGRSPVGHKHDRLSRDQDGAQLRFSSVGDLQMLSPSGSLVWAVNPSGVATAGRVKSIGGVTGTRLIAQDDGTLDWAVGGERRFSVDGDGTLTRGSVPWERITDAPTPSQESLAPFYAAMAGAATATAPIAFLGSSTTQQGFYAGRLVENLTAAYSGGVGGGLLSATNGDALPTAYTGTGVVGYNFGQSGSDTRDYLPATVLDALELTQPALIIHGIGTNDLARNMSMTQYGTALRDAVAAIDARVTVPHRHLFLTQQTRPGTFQYTPQDYTAVNRAVAAEIGGAVLDLGPPLDALDIYGADPLGLGLGDNLHMNAKGGRILGDLVSDALNIPARATPDPALYKSGPRRLTTLLNGWTGDIRIQRFGNRVELVVVSLNGSAATAAQPFAFPVGIRPNSAMGALRLILHAGNTTGQAPIYRASVGADVVTVYGAGPGGTGSTLYSEPIWFDTSDAAPTTPPWSPA